MQEKDNLSVNRKEDKPEILYENKSFFNKLIKE